MVSLVPCYLIQVEITKSFQLFSQKNWSLYEIDYHFLHHGFSSVVPLIFETWKFFVVGLPCVFCDVQLYPWPLLSRCPPPPKQPEVSRHCRISSGGQNGPGWDLLSIKEKGSHVIPWVTCWRSSFISLHFQLPKLDMILSVSIVIMSMS